MLDGLVSTHYSIGPSFGDGEKSFIKLTPGPNPQGVAWAQIRIEVLCGQVDVDLEQAAAKEVPDSWAHHEESLE